MELKDFVNLVPDFAALSHPEAVKHLCWYLHVHCGKDRITTTEVRYCYEQLHLAAPNVADVLAKLATKKPPVLLRTGNQYKLEMRIRQEMDAKYSNRPITIAIEKSLAELPPRLADETKRKYLQEALDCYKVRCNRAAILMAWNLAYDHLVNWVLVDATRLARFNAKLPNKPPFNTGIVITSREGFEWLGESEVVDICGHKDVAIITANLKKILREGLDWRNMSAHPATIEIKQVTTEHTISSLVENVVLRLI